MQEASAAHPDELMTLQQYQHIRRLLESNSQTDRDAGAAQSQIAVQLASQNPAFD